MKRKKLVFDMDGTLLDSMAMWNNFLDLYNDYDMSRIDRSFFPDVENSSSLFYSVQLVKDHVDEVMPDDYIGQQVHGFLFDFYQSENRIKDYVKEKLEKLFNNGYEIYLATATDIEYALEGLKAAEIYPYFSKFYTPDTMGIKKHSLDYYKTIAKDIKSNPEDIVFFDDASYALALAKKEGFITVGLWDHHSTETDLVKLTADYFMEDFSEIDKVIYEIENL